MRKCKECGTRKMLDLSFCVSCGGGDSVEKELDSLCREDLSFCSSLAHGKELIEKWKKSRSVETQPSSPGIYLVSKTPKIREEDSVIVELHLSGNCTLVDSPYEVYASEGSDFWVKLPEDFLQRSKRLLEVKVGESCKMTPKFYKIAAALTAVVAGVVYSLFKLGHLF